MKSDRDHRAVTRRDKLWAASMRMVRLNDQQRLVAWRELAGRLGDLAEKDVPKFDDLYRAIRGATVMARHKDDREPQ
jgi:hypothetical protein